MLFPRPLPLPHPQGRDGGRGAGDAGGAAKAAAVSARARGGAGVPLGAVKTAAEVEAGSSDSSKASSDWASWNEGSGVFVFRMEAMPWSGSLAPQRRASSNMKSLTGCSKSASPSARSLSR